MHITFLNLDFLARAARRPILIAVGCALGAALSAGSLVAQPPAEAPATWGKAADNKIYAQKLVNDLMAANPGLLSAALHATKPGEKIPVIVAHTRDLIGKPDSPEDVGFITQDQTVIGPEPIPDSNPPATRIVVHAPLRDRAGQIIGMAVLSFKLTPNMNKLAAHIRSEAIMQDLSQKIADSPALFRPVS